MLLGGNLRCGGIQLCRPLPNRLLPLAIASGSPGREIEGPMAIVILGGLITSTALNLLVLPTLALRYGRFGKTSEE